MDRRKFLFAIGSSLSAGLTNLSAGAFPTSQASVQVVEDLMQEHGVLSRLLTVYETCARELVKDKPGEAIASLVGATELITNHIQGQHERVEELMIFPVLNRANQLPELVSTLITQHKDGKELTESITKVVAEGGGKTASGRAELARCADAYARMFRAHASREDTIAYPALRMIMSDSQYAELSEKVKVLESKMKNNDDLSVILSKVDSIEKAMGLNDLAKYSS